MGIGVPSPLSYQTDTLISPRGRPIAFSSVLLTTLQSPLGTTINVGTAVPRAFEVASALTSKPALGRTIPNREPSWAALLTTL